MWAAARSDVRSGVRLRSRLREGGYRHGTFNADWLGPAGSTNRVSDSPDGERRFAGRGGERAGGLVCSLSGGGHRHRHGDYSAVLIPFVRLGHGGAGSDTEPHELVTD